MVKSGVIVVLLLGIVFFLMEKFVNVRKMIEVGVLVVFLIDCNLGLLFIELLFFIMNLVCFMMKMMLVEVLIVCIINVVYVIGRVDEVGSIEVGKKGDFVLFDVLNY